MVGGKVSRVMVDEGSKVSKGELIADLDSHISQRHLLTTEKIADAFFISKGYFN